MRIKSWKINRMKNILVVISLTALFSFGCDTDKTDQISIEVEKVETKIVEQVVEIKPVEPEPVMQAIKPPEPVAARTGEQIYRASCIGCHASGAAGAPKIGDAAAWKPRIGKGIEVLYISALQGVPGTAMMAKGTCAACSDNELKAAVDYMASKVQ